MHIDQPGCDLFFCRGAALEDGLDLVQNYPPGSVVDMEVEFLVLLSGWAVRGYSHISYSHISLTSL